MLKACNHAVYAYDVRHIILDNLQFMLSQQGRSTLDRWELQDDAVAELRAFATNHDVHITLVVHPRKDPGDQLDINSVFGSAKVTQEADNVIILQKGDDIGARHLDVKKNRYENIEWSYQKVKYSKLNQIRWYIGYYTLQIPARISQGEHEIAIADFTI